MRSDVRNTIIVPAGSSGNRTFWPKAPRCVSRIVRPVCHARSTWPGSSPASEPRLMTTTWYWPISETPDSTEMMRPSISRVRGARQEVELIDVLFFHHIVADHRFTLGLEHAQRAGIAGAIEAALADVDTLIAEHVVRVGVDELLAALDDVEHGAYRRVDAADVDVAARARHQAFAMSDDVRQVVERPRR